MYARILYVGNRTVSISSGYDRLNQRNLYLINKLTHGEFDVVEFTASTIFDKVLLHVGGSSYGLKKKILRMLMSNQYDFVFFSSSLHGRLFKELKKRFPNVKIICNFHNIEKYYAREFCKVSGIRHLPFYFAACISEKQAVQYMDYSIVLNDRDANLLRQLYDKSADLILPIAAEDSFDYDKVMMIERNPTVLYLFVGVAFFANIEAIKWFTSEVLPYVPGKLIVVGNGMDEVKDALISDRVEVHGFVKDLSSYYYQADFVVSPIKSGGGMKTKIAEALMYGKTILGSKEAFEGYMLNEKSMYLCNTAGDYIEVINRLVSNEEVCQYNEISRNLYLSRYSFDSVYTKFKCEFCIWLK